MKDKIEHGDRVQVIHHAPSQFRCGEIGYACGMRLIAAGESDERSGLYSYSGILWIIEYEDGDSQEIPSCYLKRLQNQR